MITNELLSFIRTSKAAGHTDAEIKDRLRAGGGWTEADLAEAFKSTMGSIYQPPVTVTKPVINPVTINSAVVNPVVANSISEQPVSMAPVARSGKKITVAIVILLLCAIAGGAVYAYQNDFLAKIFPSKNAYTEENFLSGILEKITQIDTASYVFSTSLKTNDREAGTRPFIVPKIDVKRRVSYENDRIRLNDIIQNIDTLAMYYNSSQGKATYPKSLQEIDDKFESNSSYIKLKDSSGKPYSYTVKPGGVGYTMAVDFETQEIIDQMRTRTDSVVFDGKRATFDETSTKYFYVSSEIPEPYLVELTEYLKSAPANMNFDANIEGAFKRAGSESATANWRGAFDFSGDFDDLSIKVAVEARKVGEDYYILVDKFPSLFFFSMFTPIKGKWIQLSPKESMDGTSQYSGGISDYAVYLERAEKGYADEKAKLANFIKNAVRLADEQKVFTFKNNPALTKVGDRDLYKYELSFDKENLKTYIDKLASEAKSSYPDEFLVSSELDKLSTYLGTQEGSDVLDYLQDNLFVTVFTDQSGMIAKIETRMRTVPPEEIAHLKGKQIDQMIGIQISDVNKEIPVTVPGDYITSQEANDLLQASNTFDDSRKNGTDSSIKSSLSNMRAYAELYYDKYSNYSGICTNKQEIFTSLLDSASRNSPSKINTNLSKAGDYDMVTCHATAEGWLVEAPLSDSTKELPYMYCVDSSGITMQKTTVSKAQSLTCN